MSKDEFQYDSNGKGLPLAHPVSRFNSGRANSMSKREFHSFVADIEELVRAATSLTGTDLADVKQKISDRIALAKQTADDARGTFSEGVADIVKAADTYVHRKPWRTLGAGVAVGTLMGMVLGRRR